MRLVEEAAGTGPAPDRMFPALVLLRWDAHGAGDRIAPLLNDSQIDEDARIITAGLLHSRGDSRGTAALRDFATSPSAANRLRSALWLAGENRAPVEQLTGIVEGASDAALLAALLALAEVDPDAAIPRLEKMAAPADAPSVWDTADGLAIVAAVGLAGIDRNRGVEALSRLAAQPYETGLGAAAVALDVDPELGVRLLSAYARNPAAKLDLRINAAKVLELQGRHEAATLLSEIASESEDAEMSLRFAGPKAALISATFEPGSIIVAAEHLTAEPEEALRAIVDGHRALTVVQPSAGVPRDPIDSMLTDFGTEAGVAPALAPQFNLGVARDRFALAMGIPLMDVPADRTYLMNYGISEAPSSDWLELMAQWAVGDFSDSPRAEDSHTDWSGPAARLYEIAPSLLEWALIAWGDEGWILNRCLPLVLQHATCVVALEMSHRAVTPTPTVILRGLRVSAPI
jgi:hypothetical protein